MNIGKMFYFFSLKIGRTSFYAKGYSAQPDMFWRTMANFNYLVRVWRPAY
jgi:hypothetical protein